jgi:fatty acid desaturase
MPFPCLQDGSYDLSAAPPFSLSDIREAIPKQCWEKNGFKSMAYLAADVAIVTGLAAGAFALNQVCGSSVVLCTQLVAVQRSSTWHAQAAAACSNLIMLLGDCGMWYAKCCT